MAHDSTPGPGALDPETIESLRAALAHYTAVPTDGAGLRRALHAMAAEAREKDLLAEQLLVVLKDVWYSLPGVQGMSATADRTRLLQRVVTMCITEYYAD